MSDLQKRYDALANEYEQFMGENAKLRHELTNERLANTLLQAAYDALECRWNKLVEDKAK